MFSRLFRSRWAALLWAAGVVWTACDVAAGTPAPAGNAATPTDALDTPIDKAALAVLANAARG